MIAQEMYMATNKNRTQPCRECIKDENRFFYYDLNTAAENSDHTQPALVMRHNVAPGMCLVFVVYDFMEKKLFTQKSNFYLLFKDLQRRKTIIL
jgi:hypothetical protein